MNADIAKGKWTQFKGKARAKWGQLTDDDLEQSAGKRDQILGKLQEKYGEGKDKLEKELDGLISKL